MFSNRMLYKVAVASLALFCTLMWSSDSAPLLVPMVFAHCDTLDGPVIRDARKALETNNVDPVLKWVRKTEEAEIRTAFKTTLAVRKLSPQAKDLADMHFFETLVRIHRAGEGEPYTGLKPAGAAVEPGIKAADKAVASGNADKLVAAIAEQAGRSVRVRFDALMAKKKDMNKNIDAGREYVAAYVSFIHFVENLHQLLSGHDGHHQQREVTSQRTDHPH